MNKFRTFDIVINLKKVENTPKPDIQSSALSSVQCEEITFTCNYCYKLHFDKKELRKHIEKHMRNDNKVKCDFCKIGFSRKTYLKEHYCIHTGEKPFSCYYCGKSFSLRCNLVRHTRIHTGEKRFPCDKCEANFTLKKTFIEHRRTHTGEKPYSCRACKQRFSRRSSLVRHVRTHTGEKNFVCHICNKRFPWKYYVKRHIVAVHEKGKNRSPPVNGTLQANTKNIDSSSTSHTCGTCGKNFKTERTMKNHAKLHEDSSARGFMKKIREELTPEEYDILATKELVVILG